MYTLYFSPGGSSMAPHAALEEIGAAYSLRRVDLSPDKPRDPDYLRLNPGGKVPTLVVDGKQPIFEAAAICLYLADRHPEAGLAPAVEHPRRGLYYQWLTHLSNTLQAAFLLFYYPERNSTDPGHAPGIKASAAAQVVESFGRLDKVLAHGPYLLGEKFSAGDLYLQMLYTWQDAALMQLDSRFPNLKRSVDRVAARPAVQRMMQQNAQAA